MSQDFPNNQPPTADSRRPARGVSLIEVLVSMGVLALGLLGVAALFPVGGHYARQTEVSDRADAIAAAALNDAVARGMLDPENWVAPRRFNAAGPRLSAVNRPFAPFLRQVIGGRIARLADTNPNVRAQAIREVNLLAGSIFVIDPLGIASTMNSAFAFNPAFAPTGTLANAIAFFPASTNPASQFQNNINFNQPGWFPWRNNGDGSLLYPDNPPIAVDESWPVRRLTVTRGEVAPQGRPPAATLLQAEAMVIASDDLATEQNDYSGNPFEFTPDNPSQQRWEISNVGPLLRQARGEFSWLLTVVPTTPEARDGLAQDAESFNYDVSAVVYYKRVTGGVFDQTGSSDLFGHGDLIRSERQVRASVATTGIGGGQLRLFNNAAGELTGADQLGDEPPLEDLRAGQWVMLFGPHPESRSTQPLLFSQWYRVLAVEEDPDADVDASVFLAGPDWPWEPSALNNQVDPTVGIQNDLRLVIVPDVVAVHTRTLKLEPGAAWGID